MDARGGALLDERCLELAEGIVKRALAAGVTVGCAESCTGGLVSAAISHVSGSSAVLLGGIVSYDPRIKHELLGVSSGILDDPALGPVSSECAAQMATGALAALSCDIAVSVTGIAGPTGAEPGKPVGTVWFGRASERGVTTECVRFEGGREEVRSQACAHALALIDEGIVELGRARA